MGPDVTLQVGNGSVAEGGRSFLVEYRDWVRSHPPPDAEAATPLPAAGTLGGSVAAVGMALNGDTDAVDGTAAADQKRSTADTGLAPDAKVPIAKPSRP